MTQIIGEPTRVTASIETLIDHIYTIHLKHVRTSTVGSLFASNHFPVAMSRKHNSALDSTSCEITYRSFKSFDVNSFLADLAVTPWSIIDICNDVNDMLDAWMLLFTEMCNRYAPTKQRLMRHQKQPDWLSEDIVTAYIPGMSVNHTPGGTSTSTGVTESSAWCRHPRPHSTNV